MILLANLACISFNRVQELMHIYPSIQYMESIRVLYVDTSGFTPFEMQCQAQFLAAAITVDQAVICKSIWKHVFNIHVTVQLHLLYPFSVVNNIHQSLHYTNINIRVLNFIFKLN